AYMIKTKMPTQQSVKSPALTQLRYGTGWPARDSTYQIEPRSPPRSLLYCQKLRQASGASSSTGRLNRPQLTKKVDRVMTKSPLRLARRQSRKSGPSSNAGYSLAAAPNPSINPAG